MSTTAPTAELLRLLDALCEQRLTLEESVRLQHLVLGSADARWLYLCYVDLHGSLFWDAAGVGSATALSADEIPAWSDEVCKPIQQAATTSHAARRKARGLFRISALFSVTACLCFGVVWWISGQTSTSNSELASAPKVASRQNQTANTIGNTHTDLKSSPRHHGPPVAIVVADNESMAAAAPTSVTASPTVPAPPETIRQQLDSREVVTAINGEIRRGWEVAEVQPSAIADDAEWLRRISLDIIGRIPTIDEADSFIRNNRPNKRVELVDQLLDDSAFARHFTTLWTNLLIGRRSEDRVNRGALQKFLRMSFASNRPWNQIVYNLVAAEGSNAENGAANFLIAHLNNDALPATAVTARLFLGQQLQCNQCHNNPFNKTQQAAFWELHSFFSQTASVPRFEKDPASGKGRYLFTDLVTRDAGGPIYFETQGGLMRVAYPRFNGHEIDPGPETNRRAALARLMTEGDQPQLAAAFVNRLWGHFFGEAFTPDVNDIGPHSPASHPELLELLTRQFIRSGYDTKQLIRWICNSEAYQLSSRVGNANASDLPVEGQSPRFSHMYVKSMTAEQMYDSFLIATRAHRAGGVDWTQAESQRQQWLSQFVVTYETDENEEAMEFDGTMNQALTLMNGTLIEKALEISPGTFLDELVRQKVDEKEKIRQMCLAVLSRPPSANELASMRKLVRDDFASRSQKNNSRVMASAESYQDLFWALLNSNEFALVH